MKLQYKRKKPCKKIPLETSIEFDMPLKFSKTHNKQKTNIWPPTCWNSDSSLWFLQNDKNKIKKEFGTEPVGITVTVVFI